MNYQPGFSICHSSWVRDEMLREQSRKSEIVIRHYPEPALVPVLHDHTSVSQGLCRQPVHSRPHQALRTPGEKFHYHGRRNMEFKPGQLSRNLSAASGSSIGFHFVTAEPPTRRHTNIYGAGRNQYSLCGPLIGRPERLEWSLYRIGVCWSGLMKYITFREQAKIYIYESPI